MKNKQFSSLVFQEDLISQLPDGVEKETLQVFL